MALVMPLGVLASQLVKIEGDLRFLSMKAAEHAGEEGMRPIKAVEVRLELIHGTLDSISSLLIKLQADINPKEPSSRPAEREAPSDYSGKVLPELDD